MSNEKLIQEIQPEPKVVHSLDELQPKLEKISSIDNQITRLLDDIKTNEILDTNTLQKTKVVMILTKIKLALHFIKRLEHLISIQMMIEDKIFDVQQIQELSLRELVGLQNINSSRIDNYYQKLNEAIYNIDLKELESQLLLITEMDNRKNISDEVGVDNSSESIKELSLALLQNINSLKTEDSGESK